jgi:hypothetical protein
MASGFQSIDETGFVNFDSNYPTMYLHKEGTTTTGSTYPGNTEIVFPAVTVAQTELPQFLIKPPLGVMFDGLTGGNISSVTGQWFPYQMPAFSAETLAFGSAPIGLSVPYWCFTKTIYDSGLNYGMQTFDENGVLTFDSETRQLVAYKWIGPSDWVFHSSKTAPDPNYTIYYYSVPTSGYDTFTVLRVGGGDAFDVGEASTGFRSAYGYGTLFCAVAARNGAMMDFGPTVLLGKST